MTVQLLVPMCSSPSKPLSRYQEHLLLCFSGHYGTWFLDAPILITYYLQRLHD